MRDPAWQCAQITERGNAGAFTLDQIGKICASGGQTCLMDDVQQVGDDHLGFRTIPVHTCELSQRGGGVAVTCCLQNAECLPDRAGQACR